MGGSSGAETLPVGVVFVDFFFCSGNGVSGEGTRGGTDERYGVWGQGKPKEGYQKDGSSMRVGVILSSSLPSFHPFILSIFCYLILCS